MSCNTEGVVDLVSVRLKYDAGKIVDRDDGVAWMTMKGGQKCQVKTNEMPKGDDQGCWYKSVSSWTSHLALVD